MQYAKNYRLFGAPVGMFFCIERDLGMALGHADPDERANQLQSVREPVDRFARFSGF